MSVRDFFRIDDTHPFTGRHMLAVVLAFFGVIISVNAVMAVAATGTFSGVIVKNSYVASQNYNRLKAEAAALPGASWSLDVAAPDGLLAVGLVDDDGALKRDLDVRVAAGRPSSIAEDRMLDLRETADGYHADDALAPGQWLIEVAAWRGGDLVFREQRRVFVRAGG